MAIDRTKKVSEFARISRAGTDDLLLLVNDPEGTPSTRTITIKNLYNDVGAEAIFYANTTHKANVHFQSNTLFTGNDNRFQSNVHLTSNLYIGTGVSMSAFGRTYSGSNPPIANTEFQSFVANTNEFILTLQETGTFLLPNGSFAVANLTYQTDLANTNSRILGLESYGQLASNLHVINTYVANTVFQGALANTNSNMTDRTNRIITLETKMANQESLTANGFNEAFSNAISYSYANMVLYTNENYIPRGDANTSAFDINLTGNIINRGLRRFNDHFWEPNQTPQVLEKSANGGSAVFDTGNLVGVPSPSLSFHVTTNSDNTALVLTGASVKGTEHEVIWGYPGFTYSFYPQWNDYGRNIVITTSPGGSLWANTKNLITVNTGFSYTSNDIANTVTIIPKTVFTIPMDQVSSIYYQDSANAQMYGEIRIRS